MSISQTDVDRLERALARGELTVETSDGSRVTYRSIDELLKALAYAKQVLATAVAGSTTQSFATFTRD